MGNQFFNNEGKFKTSDHTANIGSDIMSTHEGKEVSDGIWQPFAIYNREVRVGFHKERVPFQFTSQTIFISKADGVHFIPYYIKQLIKEGSLPEDVVDANGIVDEKQVQCGVAPLKVGALEKDDK